MNVILVDDEQLALDVMIYNFNKIDNINVKGTYLNPSVLKKEGLDRQVDVAFLDINLPEITGLELAEILLEENPYLIVVFVTAYNQYAVEAFELNALDYLVKPVSIDRLQKTVTRIRKILKHQNETLKNDNSHLRIKVSNQLMIENKLGDFEKLTWRTSRAKELFLYLLLNQSFFVSKSSLVEMFWADFESERAYAQLYSTIYQIRKTLLPYAEHIKIKNMSDGYLFTMKNAKVDLVVWEREIEKKEPLNDSTIDKHVENMALYSGPYLNDYDYLWAEPERYRLEQLWIDSVFNIANWYNKSGDLNKALTFYKEISVKYPEMEEVSFSQMKIHAYLGNQSLVFKIYEALDNAVKDKLDIPLRADIVAWFKDWKKDL